MERNRRFGLFGRGARSAEGQAADGAASKQPAAGVPEGLSGAALEQAYRQLLLENMVLAQSNQRLHERLAQREAGQEESPAARRLIQAQRNALAERSHRMRELEYQGKQLERERKRLMEQNQRLAARLDSQQRDLAALRQELDRSQQQLAATAAELRDKRNEVLRLTDRCYQLEARLEPRRPTASAANGDF